MGSAASYVDRQYPPLHACRRGQPVGWGAPRCTWAAGGLRPGARPGAERRTPPQARLSGDRRALTRAADVDHPTARLRPEHGAQGLGWIGRKRVDEPVHESEQLLDIFTLTRGARRAPNKFRVGVGGRVRGGRAARQLASMSACTSIGVKSASA